jgi:hypothetical protein
MGDVSPTRIDFASVAERRRAIEDIESVDARG